MIVQHHCGLQIISASKANAITADGKYLASGTNDGDDDVNLWVYKNNRVTHPSLIPYNPRDGSEIETPVLRWFSGSDNRSSLKFDVYLDTNSNPTTKVANNITDFSYTPTNLDRGSKYYWKIVATDSFGTKTSSIMNFTYNSKPVISNYALSSSSIARTSTSVISVQVSDTKDSASDLTVSAQYRATSGGWKTAYLSTFWYDSSASKWKTNFTPTSSAILGDYDIRIMVNDTDGASTGWTTYSDVITVTNNVPSLSNYGLSTSSVLRSNAIVIGMNTTDTEDGESSHTVVVQYRATSGGWQTSYLSTVWYDSSDSRWETNFTVPTTAPLGTYDVRIMVNDTDSGSSWLVHLQ